MIKKSLLPIALILMVSLLAGCGGGTGSSSAPEGVHSTVPSIVQLLPVQQIVQTNSFIALKAKVLDGNGAVVAGVPVVFTNLSLLGTLDSTTAVTDSLGFATVSLFSTDSGFATIQAEVNTGTGKVRDKKTVFFSIFDLFLPTVSALPTLTLAVDSNNNGIYDETSDFFLSTGEGIVRATVMDETGSPVSGDSVVYGADSSELTFPDGNVKTTNPEGQAFARVKVVPSEIRNFDTPVNVSAVSTITGAFNVITLFLTPIEVGNITVFADPSTVASGGTSTISAVVTTAVGTPVPDGTTVNFTANGGTVSPFGQTTDGLATATWKAPTVTADTSFSITGRSGGKSASTSVFVTAPLQALTVTPGSRSVVSQATTQTVTFTITGGTAPYTTISSDPTKVFNGATPGNGTFTGATVNATVAANACPGTVTLTVFDSAGASKTATVTIVSAAPFTVTPLAVVCVGTSGVCTPGSVTVSGGTLPYTTASSNEGVVPTPTPPAASGGTFNVVAIPPVLSVVNLTITVRDACGATASVAVTVNP